VKRSYNSVELLHQILDSGNRIGYLCKTQRPRPNLHLTKLVRDRLLGLGLALYPLRGTYRKSGGYNVPPHSPVAPPLVTDDTILSLCT